MCYLESLPISGISCYKVFFDLHNTITFDISELSESHGAVAGQGTCKSLYSPHLLEVLLQETVSAVSPDMKWTLWKFWLPVNNALVF